MKTRKRLCYAATLLALISLASCGQNDSDDTLLPAGKYPMTFTTSVNGLAATRATTDNSWDGGEQVALQVDGEVKEYQISGSGPLATLTSSDPFYWTSTDETKTVKAWYYGDRYSAAELDSWKVESDQSAADNSAYKASDFLYAPAKDISFGSENKSLAFYHQTARVVINILKEEAATNASQITGVTFGENNNLALSGKYTAPDGKANFGTWDTASGASMGTITPKAIDTPTGGSYLKSYTALLIPQNMQGKEFIAITLADDQTYYYVPEGDDAKFEAGKEYTYDVTVQYGHLDAVLVSVNGTWGGGDTEEVKSTAPGFSAYDLKIGDYYYSDGKTSDGGYRKYADGTTELLEIKPVLTSANGQTRNVIGIVFWVGDATKKDDTLADEHPGCTHGLVVALNDAANESVWQDPRIFVQDWLNKNWQDKYLTLASGIEISDPLHNIQGYNNTKAIEEFNDGSAGNLVQAVSTVVDYRKNVLAPNTSSNWYLPSVKELTLLCGEDVDDIWMSSWYDDMSTANKELINKKIGLIGNGATEISSKYYWSSTEYSYYQGGAFGVNFGDGNVKTPDKNNIFSVRCVLAF